MVVPSVLLGGAKAAVRVAAEIFRRAVQIGAGVVGHGGIVDDAVELSLGGRERRRACRRAASGPHELVVDGNNGGVVGLAVGGDGLQAEEVELSGGEVADKGVGGFAGEALYLGELLTIFALLDNDGGSILLRVGPCEASGGGIRQGSCRSLWRKDVVALRGEAVDVVFDVGVAFAESVGGSIVNGGVEAVLLFPVVGHAVAISVGRRCTACQSADTSHVVLVGDEGTTLSKRCKMVDDAKVVAVANTRGTTLVGNGLVGLGRRFKVHGSRALEVRLLHGRGAVVIRDEGAVQTSVGVTIIIVAFAVEVVGGRPVVEILIRPVGTSNEVVVHHVLIVIGCRVTTDDAHRIVVDHIIIILNVALHLRIAAFVVGPQTMVDGPVAGAVGDGAEALRLYAFGDDAMLPSDVVGIGDVDVVPRSP